MKLNQIIAKYNINKRIIERELIEMDDQIPVRYLLEAVAHYSDQTNFELGMYREDGKGLGNGVIGLLEYVIYKNEIRVSDIKVLPKYRRRGVGSRLIQKMKQEHPHASYKPSLKTDLGTKFKHKDISPNEMGYI